MASGGGQTSGSGSLRSDAGLGLGTFLVGFVLAWAQREALLGWAVEPFLGPWLSDPRIPPQLLYMRPVGLFLTYLALATCGGFVAALPFLARLCCRIRPSVRAKLSGFRFDVASYLSASAGIVLSRRILFPGFAKWFVERFISTAPETNLAAVMTDCLNAVLIATAGLVVLLEVGVIAATSWMRRGPRPPATTHGLGGGP